MVSYYGIKLYMYVYILWFLFLVLSLGRKIIYRYKRDISFMMCVMGSIVYGCLGEKKLSLC